MNKRGFKEVYLQNQNLEFGNGPLETGDFGFQILNFEGFSCSTVNTWDLACLDHVWYVFPSFTGICSRDIHTYIHQFLYINLYLTLLVVWGVDGVYMSM